MTTLISRLDEGTKETENGKHYLSVMTPEEGDVKTMWDPDNETEVKLARKAFDNALAVGLVPFYVDRKGKQTVKMQAFDPEATAIIFAPALQGG